MASDRMGATDFGKWVGGVMRSAEGGNSPVARNTMAARLVAHGKRTFGTDCDVLVIAVPSGLGDAFMEKFVEGVGATSSGRPAGDRDGEMSRSASPELCHACGGSGLRRDQHVF